MWIDITEKDHKQFNNLAAHPLQSFEWGEFRKKTGIKVIRKGFVENKKLDQAFQLTIHPIPHTSFTIGYLPKGVFPTKQLIEELEKIGKTEKCIFIQLEPNVVKDKDNNSSFILRQLSLIPSAHPLFTKYTLEIDLTKSEEEILKNMHPKARYNIKVAQKHGVIVKEEDTKQAFEEYLKLTEETTKRQGFFAHSKKYHELMWETLKAQDTNLLTAHLLVARYNAVPLTTWVLFKFHDKLYYPYGASSNEYREVMHSTLEMWEAIRFGKKNKLKTFDLWGAASPNAPESDPWFGFTKFKERFGPERVEFIGSYDLVINPLLYQFYKLADKLRWVFLHFK